MSTHLKVFPLVAILIASVGLTPAYGQIVEPISVTTDKGTYENGETIMVTGDVKDFISGTPVSLQVIAPNSNLVSVEQLDIDSSKQFSAELIAGGALWSKTGTYTIKVLYGSQARTAETTIEFTGPIEGSAMSSTTAQVAGTDFMLDYEIIGGVLKSITPDVDAKSLIVNIQATDFGSLTITLPREVIDSKMNGEDDQFFVLVDGEEVRGFEETKTDTHRTLTIMFPPGAEEIEIIGTFVIPEFGAIAALVLAVAIVSIIAVSAKSRLSLMPRY